MKRSVDSLAWTAVAVGLFVSGAFAGRLPVYPVAVALLLPLTAICVHGIIRNVARRTLPQHLSEPANAIATRLVIFIIALHVLVRMHRFAGYTTVIAGCAVGVAGLFLSGPAIGRVVSIFAIGSVASLSLAYWKVTHD